ncbi:TolC family protein [Marinobacter hydrocarbonoclasticus]|uniref:TolC family protein n=1 Tax=Marinobacter nauticus TaxID=2743 RepID=UPI001C978EB5|nr:TolC family protein [Marinobacter nauticus]MBY6194585.1 TolC family protein [Marinobacter nauticus]MBY6215733.1 TolC family protein [Marinobacter nauticus]
MRRVFITFIYVCINYTSHAVAFEPIEIGDLVEAALRKSPQLEAARSRLSQQQVEQEIARDARWPTLSGFVEQTSASESRLQFRLSQTLYDWGVTSGQIDLADIEANKVELEFEQVREEEIEAILELALDWSSAGESIKVLNAHLLRLQNLKDLASSRVGSVIDRGELSRVRAAIAGAQIELSAAEYRVQDALDQIRERVGRNMNLNYLDRPLNFNQWFADDISMSRMSKLLPSAPAVREADLGILEAQIEKKLARSEWRPRVSLDAIAERTEDRFGADTDRRIALRIESPIFQGLSAFKRPESAEYALSAAIKRRDLSLSEVRLTVLRLIHSANLQSNRAPLINQQIQAARSTVKLYTQQFRIGRRDMSDLVGAESERLSAELSAIDLEFEQLKIKLQLYSTLGLLARKIGQKGEGVS